MYAYYEHIIKRNYIANSSC